MKLHAVRPATLLKWTPIQIFSDEYCELFKNTHFEEHLRTAASVTGTMLHLQRCIYALFKLDDGGDFARM